MDQLLEEDKSQFVCFFSFGLVHTKTYQILRIRLYVVRGFENTNTSYGDRLDYGTHESIRKYYGKPHLEKIIGLEIANKRGRLMVTSEYPVRINWKSLMPVISLGGALDAGANTDSRWGASRSRCQIDALGLSTKRISRSVVSKTSRGGASRSGLDYRAGFIIVITVFSSNTVLFQELGILGTFVTRISDATSMCGGDR